MTAPFQPERSELPRPVSAAGNGLNSEYANLIQSTQRTSADRPQVVSADGSQLVIPPLGQTTDQAVAAANQTGNQTDASQTAPTTKTDNIQTNPAPTDNGQQLPQSVAYNPSLAVPSWQRFSQTPVATDGSMMPADGPGSPGDPGPGPAIPMWMRMAPPGMISQQELNGGPPPSESNELASQNRSTANGGNGGNGDASNTGGADGTNSQNLAQTDATSGTNQNPGGQTAPLVT
jgi:hypothetical protein